MEEPKQFKFYIRLKQFIKIRKIVYLMQLPDETQTIVRRSIWIPSLKNLL